MTRLLLVDDDPSFCRVIQRVLDHAGFAVTAAESGEAALSLAASNPPDVIVLDSHLPGLDGLGFVRAYRTSAQCLPPIIAISGRHDPALFASLVGAAAFLRKPFPPTDLVATVRRVLSAPASARLPSPAAAPKSGAAPLVSEEPSAGPAPTPR